MSSSHLFYFLIYWLLWNEEAKVRCFLLHSFSSCKFAKVCTSFLAAVMVACKIFEELFSFKGMNIYHLGHLKRPN